MARRGLLKNEDGYLTIVAALVILALLTVIGDFSLAACQYRGDPGPE